MSNIINLRTNKNLNLLNEFIKLYDKTFKDGDTKEDPAAWKDNLYNTLKNNNPDKLYNCNLQSINDSVYFNTTNILLSVDENNKVLGGVVYEYYHFSKCALITYLVVDKKHRYKGIGSTLVHNVIMNLRNEHIDLRYIFTEVQNPMVYKEMRKSPLVFFKSLDFTVLTLPYVQPPLRSIPNSKPVKNLLLLAYKNKFFFKLYKLEVLMFLYEFYKVQSINNPMSIDGYDNMCKYIISHEIEKIP